MATPADLQIQWREELRDKFGLEFWIVDTELAEAFVAHAGFTRIRGSAIRV
ncbi:MAG: hypothetical protein ACRDLR_03500 [Gaiellaceae bacterium]